jgi:hypothetical protein
MKAQPKRTTTQQGLGKVTAESPRDPAHDHEGSDGAAARPRVRTRDSLAPPPISAPPPGGAGSSGASAPRHTREIESGRPAARRTRDIESVPPTTPSRPSDAPIGGSGPVAVDPRVALGRESAPPKSLPLERVEPLDRAERTASARMPIDVTHVDTERLPRAPSTRVGAPRPAPVEARRGRSASSAPADRSAEEKNDDPRTARDRFAVAEPRTGTRRVADSAPGGSRTVDGRPVGGAAPGRAASNPPRRTSVKPPSNRPRRTSTRPPAPREKPTLARSTRPSIREDHVGPVAQRGPIVAAGSSSSAPSVPRLLLSKEEIAAAPIDHRAGFLLAHIDGVTSVQGLVDIAGMAEKEVHEILDRLRRLGIVGLR